MKYYFDIKQNTPEWLNIRKGKFTASMFSDLFSAPSTATYKNAINKIVFERLTGEIPESFSNGWTERGHELESEAVEAYELKTFNKVKLVGFVERDEITGCSPDGLIADDGQLQIKSPKFSTLIEYLLSDKIPNDYMIQMQGEMFVTDRLYNEFFVYHPKLKPILKRVPRDEQMIKDIAKKIDEANKEVEKRISIIKKG